MSEVKIRKEVKIQCRSLAMGKNPGLALKMKSIDEEVWTPAFKKAVVRGRVALPKKGSFIYRLGNTYYFTIMDTGVFADIDIEGGVANFSESKNKDFSVNLFL